MSARAPDLKHGKEFEKEVHEQFRKLYLKYPCTWERVVDSHDAGNIVRQADCDFKLTVKSPRDGAPWVFNIECKASVKYLSLADGGACRKLIKSDQIALMRIARRAGVGGVYMFKSTVTGIVEVWEADQVIDAWKDKGKRNRGIDSTPIRFHVSGMDVFAENLVKELLSRS